MTWGSGRIPGFDVKTKIKNMINSVIYHEDNEDLLTDDGDERIPCDDLKTNDRIKSATAMNIQNIVEYNAI